ncbi:MAG TPA: galactokinase [Polyangiaceae bacterium]|nr:galactokinase [Polyangiaceae bacterium]
MRARFAAAFGRPPELVASAPGRVNLIGEHTDYNDGFVLPVATPMRTRVAVARAEGRRARVASGAIAGAPEAYELGAEARRGGWVDYLQGVTAALAAAGHRLGGFDALVESDVPLGAGLSSSAALEIALGRALRELFALPVDDVALAVAGRRAENELVGAPVGIMDQMASSLADERHALYLDTRSLAYERVPLPEGAELVVIDSGVAHRHADGGYKTRRAECERAAAALGVGALRDVGDARLAEASALPEPIGRRARHVVTENARVLAAVAALRAGDLAALGRLFDASHASLRDDFEVSVPELDRLVELARSRPGAFGARMTGGGFGGSIVALVERGRGVAIASAVAEAYAREYPGGRVLMPAGEAG